MGQGSSRQEPSSPQRHPHSTSNIFRPDYIAPSSSEHSSPSQTTSPQSTFFGRRTIQTLTGADNSEESLQLSSRRRRARLSRCHPSRLSRIPSTLWNRHNSPSQPAQPSRLPSPPSSTSHHQRTPTPPDPSQLQIPSSESDLDFPPLTRSRPLTRNPTDLIEGSTTPHSEQSRSGSRWRPRSPFRSNIQPPPMLSWRRRSPIRRNEDTNAVLTRLLSAAAAATAISLTGGDTSTGVNSITSGGRSIDGDDGSFDGFLQSLSNGGIASTLNQGDGARPDRPDADASLGQPAQLDFFRMFRFGSSDTSQGTDQVSPSRRSSSRRVDGSQRSVEHGQPEVDERDRLVPVLIVGIRALSDQDAEQERIDGVPSFFGSLASFPSPVTVGGTGEAGPEDELLLPARRRSRRSTVGGLNFFSSDREGFRSQDRPRPASSFISPSDSPFGPHPPPPTPASPGLSALPSGNTTPTRRSSISSTLDLSSSQSRRGSLYRRLTGTALEPTLEEHSAPEEQSTLRPRGLRRRPRIHSWGEGSRHDTRRNGVLMEPSTETPSENSSTRSWIIYILGGNYPEHHPILTTPSLFTDNPTYEDMLLLSTLLGPAKPPVANAQDVAASGGLYAIRSHGGETVACELDGKDEIKISPSEQCQVCLSGYEEYEDARRLMKCKHLFHRECIDQVS